MKYTNRQIRRNLRMKGIPCTMLLPVASIKIRILYYKTGNIHWIFAEDYGFVILNLVTMKAFNHARMKNNIRKWRVRDMDKHCISRYPRKGWMKKDH